MPKPTSYGRISQLNHWIIAAAMIGSLAFGLYLAYGGVEGAARGPLIGIHSSVGVLILIFGTWRVLWRLMVGFPQSVSSTPQWQVLASKVAHWALLAGILIMPLSGIAKVVFRARAVDVFGWFSIPAQAEIPWIVSFASGLHHFVGIGLSILVVLHVAAALKHHFIDRDLTLTRMISGRSET